jgi:hypothetical protein
MIIAGEAALERAGIDKVVLAAVTGSDETNPGSPRWRFEFTVLRIIARQQQECLAVHRNGRGCGPEPWRTWHLVSRKSRWAHDDFCSSSSAAFAGGRKSSRSPGLRLLKDIALPAECHRGHHPQPS